MILFPDSATAQILHSLPDAVIAVDSNSQIRFLNSAAEDLTGYSNVELKGQSTEVLVAAWPRAVHDEEQARYHSAPCPQQRDEKRDLQLRRKDGVLIQVAVNLSPIEGQGAGIILSTFRDVGDRDRSSKEYTLLAELGALVGRQYEIRKVFESLDSSLPNLFQFDRLVVTSRVAGIDLLERVHVSGLTVPGEGVGTRVPLPEAFGGAKGSSRGSILDGDSETITPTDSPIASAGLRSWVQAALGDPDNPIGYLSLRSFAENAYSDKDLLLLDRVAMQISPAIENARLYAQAQREAHDKAVLAEVSRIITSTADIEEVYALVADQIRELVQFDRIVVSTIDQGYELATVRYVAGLKVEGGEAGTTHTLVNSLLGEVIKDPLPRWFSHAELVVLMDRYPKVQVRHRVGLRSMVTAPLIWGDEVIGLLILHSKSENAYGEPEAIAAAKIANQISGAVANAELLVQTRRKSDEMSVLAEISRVITSEENLEGVFDKFAERARRLIPFDLVVVRTFDDQRSKVVDRYVDGVVIRGFEPGRSVPFPGSAAEESISGTLPKRINRSEAESWAARHPELGPGLDAGLHSFLLAPLTWNGVTNGLLAMSALGADAFDGHHAELAGRIADQISGAISKSRSHEAELLAEKERLASQSRERELELLNEQRSEFLSTVSHELKTPLACLVAFADILAKNRDANLTERQLQQINVMQRSSRMLDVLINDLLDVSKLEAGSFKLDKQEFEIGVLLKEISDAFMAIVQPKRQTLKVSYEDQQIWLCGDRARVAQVIVNLLSNAAKYSGEESVITLSAAADGGVLTFMVKDSGIGISEEDQQNLFTPFFRAFDEATRSEPGTGLGLVIVKNIVKLHGGDVSLESQKGVGTTVRVIFPDYSDAPSEAYLEAQRDAAKPVVPHSRLDEIQGSLPREWVVIP